MIGKSLTPKIMVRLLIPSLIVLGVFVLMPGASWAHHYTYMQENPNDRTRYSHVYEWNGTFVNWANGDHDTLWKDDGAYTEHIRIAIQSWEDAVPELTFKAAGTKAHNLRFKRGYCDLFTDACMRPLKVFSDATRDADYMLTAEVVLTLAQPNLTALGIQDQLRHEIGHWIGLDEQYYEDGIRPCSDVLSVMNASFSSNGQNCKGVHAPTEWDINAVTAYWKGTGLASAALEETTTRQLELEWADTMWAEAGQVVKLWYYEFERGIWIETDYIVHYDDIGFHRDSVARTMEREWTVDGSSDMPVDAWYMAGVTAYSWPYEEWKPWEYSVSVYVD